MTTKENKMMSQSQHYEQAANTLNGADKARALRAAQNALLATAPSYMADFKRLQDKLITCLDVDQAARGAL